MKDSVGLVTGGAGHIGRAVCRRLAEQGANIVVLDKDETAGKAFVDELEKDYSVTSALYAVDLIEQDIFQSIRTRLEADFGRLDFLINNAAFYDDTPGWGVPFEDEGYEAWIKVMQVNLLAPFFLAQQLFPLMSKSKNASIVNVSSIYGIVGPDHRLYTGTDMTNPAAYSASKGGIIQVTKWLSTVLAPNIRVNCVTPGGVERGQSEIFIERYQERTPLRRMATEKDIVGIINFLLSDEASYITGQNMVVDGGWTVW